MFQLESTEIGSYRRLQNKEIILNPKMRRVNPKMFSGGTKILPRGKCLNLHLGKEQFKDEGGGEVLETILSYIMKMSPEKGKPLKEVIGADFVSPKKALNQILYSSYIPSKFEIEAVRWNGVIFLYVREGLSSYQCQYEVIGYKFEQYMTLLEDGSVPNYNDPPSNAEQDKIVLRTTLSNPDTGSFLNLFYGSEIDCIFDDRYCELKTLTRFDEKWANRAGLKAYWQSILGTVPNIIFGFPNRGLFVEKIKLLPVDNIPNLPGVYWSRDECLRRLSEVLEEIKRRLPADSNCLLIRFEKDKFEYEEMPDDSFNLLTPDFINHFTE